jgi:hypothetical protein
MKIKFSFLVALSAALIAGCAAYYSVFGLSQLFAGASLAVIIMASSLEFSKVVAVSFLHRYWNKISGALKIYLSIGVFVLVCVTSAGIYGFLSNAYQKTAYKLEISDGQSQLIDSKKKLFEKNINDNNNIIITKTNRLQQLTNLRTTQESRFDLANNSNRNKIRTDISNSNQEIQKLNSEIDVLNAKNTSLSDSVSYYANKLIEFKSSNNISAEIGPLKYLSQLTGYPMDKVVNWFILLLIFVFDPLAVALVIATNRVLELERNPDSQPTQKPIEEKKTKKRLKFLNSIGSSISSIFSNIGEKLKKKEKVKIEENPNNILPARNENTNRGFSVNIPQPEKNDIERIGSNKIFKNGDKNKIFFKKK